MKIALIILFSLFLPINKEPKEPVLIVTTEIQITENGKGVVTIPLFIDSTDYIIRVPLDIKVDSRYKKF